MSAVKHYSPLRYPGGKAQLSGLLAAVIAVNGRRGGRYYEPFAGGGGAALSLLNSGVVSELYLNDADVRIYAFWQAALHQPEEFAELILTAPLTVDEWRRQRAMADNPEGHSDLAVGFAAFYMNRCNRSGIITGAGPIGGYQQRGEWGLGARFYRETLAARVRQLAEWRGKIHLSCEDALAFLARTRHNGDGADGVPQFVYLDPPYVGNGRRLYLNYYGEPEHRALAEWLGGTETRQWLMSYDDSEFIRELYGGYQVDTCPIQYILQRRQMARELLIAPHHLKLPEPWHESNAGETAPAKG